MDDGDKKLAMNLLKKTMKGLKEDLPDVTHKNTLLAGFLGFLFGGIGLGLYFQSWRDFLFPILLFVFLSLIFPVIGTGVAILITSGWGIIRTTGWPTDDLC